MVQWGIIGCGEVTEIKSGPAFNNVKGSILHAVMRRDAVKAKDYAERHSVPVWYSNAADLINDNQVNAIYIATPPLYHEQYTIEALRQGKPVYVEKPMSVDVASAQRMAQAVKEYNGKLCVAHYRREHPFFKAIKKQIDEGTIGKIKFIRMEFYRPKLPADKLLIPRNAWRIYPEISGGGLFYDLAPHQLDLMLYFFGPIKYIGGYAENQTPAYKAEDCTVASIAFDNGILFSGTWCFDHPTVSLDNCVITGSEGTISFSIFGKQEMIIQNASQQETISFETPAHVQQPLIAKVVDYFSGLGENPSPVENGLRIMEIMQAICSKK